MGDSGDWEYWVNNDWSTATMSHYIGDAEEVIIPNKIDGFVVSGLLGRLFQNDTTTSIKIPDSVTWIGEETFRNCHKLSDIKVSPDNEYYAAIDHVLFNKKEKTLCAYPMGLDAETYSIPRGILRIDDCAFYHSKLTSIEIPDSVTTIGEEAFSCCDRLTSVEIPDSVTTIGELAFSFCPSLTSIEIPDSVTEIGRWAFDDCNPLLILTVGRDSYAEQYAEENDIIYIYPDATSCL